MAIIGIWPVWWVRLFAEFWSIPLLITLQAQRVTEPRGGAFDSRRWTLSLSFFLFLTRVC